MIDCSSFIRHLWQNTKHIKWSSKVVHKNNTIRAYNHTTYITRSYSASQVSCTHVLVVWISSNQFHVSHLGQYCNWCLYIVLPRCQWRRKLGWQAHVLTHDEDIRTRCTPRGMHCRYGSWIQVIVKTHTIYKTRTIVLDKSLKIKGK